MDGPEHYRLFVALPITETVRGEIAGVQNELRDALSSRAVRWTRTDQLHLTLKFLGDVAVDRVDLLTGFVRKACAEISSLSLTAEKLGCFPNDRRPRVIWIGVRDNPPQLEYLQKTIDTATAKFGSAEREMDFKGHITIGRVKEINAFERKTLGSFFSKHRATNFGTWTANQVKIVRSELSDSGATHKDVMAIPLSAP